MFALRRSILSFLPISIALIVFATDSELLRAQEATSGARATNHDAIIKGTVKSENGDRLVKVQITLVNLSTEEKTDAKTDKKGEFRFLNLFPGRYRLEVKTDKGETAADEFRLKESEKLVRNLVARRPG